MMSHVPRAADHQDIHSWRTIAVCTLIGMMLTALTAAPLSAQDGERALAQLEVRSTPAFASAVEAGTRTASGVPGESYWQQRVDYDIDVTVDPATRLLTGSETITYTNHSPNTLNNIFFHLYQNLFAEGGIRTRAVPLTGGMWLDRLAINGVEREVDAANHRETVQTGTVMAAKLPDPLPPGGSVTIEIDWHFTIPEGEGVPRMGMVDATTGQLAQWYPQVAAYDDLVGWDTRPYLSNGEFYLEYGTIDLAVTVPAGTLVAATGELTNAEEVMPSAIRERLAQADGSDDIVHVVTADDFGPGKATRGQAGETITWRFHAEDVRDVAFAFGDHYLWDATSGVVDQETGRRTAVYTFFRPTANNWVDSAKMAKGAVETFSRNVYPYTYPHITSTEGLAGGMEYPMLVFVRNFGTADFTQRVIAHEIGHEWFPMMVGSDETGYAWMDEGVNTFITIFAAEDYYPESNERQQVRDEYRGYARTNNVYMGAMAPPDGIAAGGASLGALGYRHPGTALLALREILGHETYDRALNEYTDRWLYKHPAPFDFFNTFEEVAGQDLDWFWVPWLYGPGISDQAIGGVERNGDEVVITVRNEGTVLSPIKAEITNGDGDKVLAEVPASVWFDGRHETQVKAEVDGAVTRVELDPEGLFADIDPSDDVFEPMQTE